METREEATFRLRKAAGEYRGSTGVGRRDLAMAVTQARAGRLTWREIEAATGYTRWQLRRIATEVEAQS